MSLGESLHYYMQDVALLGKVFARGEGRVGDKVEGITLGRCLQRERGWECLWAMGYEGGEGGSAHTGPVS